MRAQHRVDTSVPPNSSSCPPETLHKREALTVLLTQPLMTGQVGVVLPETIDGQKSRPYCFSDVTNGHDCKKLLDGHEPSEQDANDGKWLVGGWYEPQPFEAEEHPADERGADMVAVLHGTIVANAGCDDGRKWGVTTSEGEVAVLDTTNGSIQCAQGFSASTVIAGLPSGERIIVGDIHGETRRTG